MTDLNFIFPVIFYSLIIFIIYLYKDKFEIHAKIIAIYKTKIGLKAMDKIAKKFPRSVKLFGLIGIVFGFLGMIYISYILIQGFVMLLTQPDAPAIISPVIPGIKIPGSPIFVPFWYGIISIFLVASIHEFSHGVVATVHKIKVKNSGIVFFGPIVGAFVEPDEKELRTSSIKKQLSVYAAGPFSNIVTGILVILLLSFVLVPVASEIVSINGILVSEIQTGFPAEVSGIEPGALITNVNGIEIVDIQSFTDELAKVKVGDMVTLSDNVNEYKLEAGIHPEDSEKSYLGVIVSQNYELKEGVSSKLGNYLPWSIFYAIDFFKWLFILSLGIGLANLLPLGPVDGGRMLLVSLTKLVKPNKVMKIWKSVSGLFLLLLLFNLFFPYISYILNYI